MLTKIPVKNAIGSGLDDYISKPDTSYGYSESKVIEHDGISIHILKMTSQSWRSAAEVNRRKWQHWLVIYKPKELRHTDKALLWINAGDNKHKKLPRPDQMLSEIAKDTSAIVADLQMVPNQPLEFNHDGEERYEDNLVAYSLNKYCETGDEGWPVLFPMVKSAVRAMDTIQEYGKRKSNGKIDIQEFVVSGASKRGWTTWLTAAADSRVIAIAPAVIDMLNIPEQRKHQHEAYGFYLEATKDYQQYRNLKKFDNERSKALLKLIDPYSYIDRLTIPKYIINSAQDEFFLPDSSRFYFDKLMGEKMIRYIANTNHSLKGSDADRSLAGFYYSILNNIERPEILWDHDGNTIYAEATRGQLSAVRLWQAVNRSARDFRLETIGPVWESRILAPGPNKRYSAKLAKPASGWKAYFIEMEFMLPEKMMIKLTTEVLIVPENLPYEK